MIKKAAKSYGFGNWLEGVVDPDFPALVIDDVAGSGKTILAQAARRHAWIWRARSTHVNARGKSEVDFRFGSRNRSNGFNTSIVVTVPVDSHGRRSTPLGAAIDIIAERQL
jgi:hypothetical protein